VLPSGPPYIAPPPPLKPTDWARVEHTRLRRRMLYSQHAPDVTQRLVQAMGPTRAEVQGRPDLSVNIVKAVYEQVMVLYNVHPTCYPPTGSDPVTEALDTIGYWPQMQRVSRDVGGLREMLVRFDLDEAGDMVRARPVFPDLVEAEADVNDPSRAAVIVESVEHPTLGWVRHRLSIANPEAPSYTVTLASNQRDVTLEVLGMTEWPEKFRNAAGAPILPYAWYHAAKTGYLFDPWAGAELVEGSLNIAVGLTNYHHLLRTASWGQRWGIGVEPAGADSVEVDASSNETTVVGSAARREMVTDPATVALFQAIPDVPNPQLGQWSPPGDPEAVLRSLMTYKQHVFEVAGLGSPDVTANQSDIRSGYSLAVSREAVRDQQRVYEPQFRVGDQQAMSIVACLLNRHRGTTYSEDPITYEIAYHGLPLSPMEEKARLDKLRAEQEAGLIGPITAYQSMHPEVPYEQARNAVAVAMLERDAVNTAVANVRREAGNTDVDVLPQAPLTAQQLQYATTLVQSAATGQIPVKVVRAMLVSVVGLTSRAADAIVADLIPAPPPTTPPADAQVQ